MKIWSVKVHFDASANLFSMEKKDMSDKITPDPLVGATARWTAGVRAKESAREDCLFNDPWAAALAGQEGQIWVEQRPADSIIPIILRTRFFDDFLQRITLQNGLRQVVLMAAGLDTRAFRLTWPEQTRLFELDQPAVLQSKAQILQAAGAQPACDRQTIAEDLTGSWQDRLIQAGFEPQYPSVWLLEGFLFYLASENLTRILDEVMSLAAPGSWLGFDIINSAMLTSSWTRPWLEMQAKSGAPWIGVLDDPEGFLAARGWKCSLSQAGAPEANHGRWPYSVIPPTMPGVPHNWFVTAWKEG
jgi:methyltransferase (TIGR00027 family)